MDVDKKIYLTFDMDWACDEVMDFLYDALEQYNLSATINITNVFSTLEKYKKNKKIHLGIHPNFNFLIDGSKGGSSNKEEVIRRRKDVIPDAVVARSHSLLNSSPITKSLYDHGIRFELNHFIEPYEGICVYPWLFQGVVQVPFFYEDDLWLLEESNNSPSFYLSPNINMHKVFNFHPIHLFLNSECLERYGKIKGDSHNFSFIKKNVNANSYGIWDFFLELIGLARKRGYQFEVIETMEVDKWRRKQ